MSNDVYGLGAGAFVGVVRIAPKAEGAFALLSENLERYSGDGLIAGISPGLLTVDGVPASRTIRVYDRGPAGDSTNLGTGVLVRQVQSAPDGSYLIPNLSVGRKFTVMAVDDEGIHNAVVADMIVPVIPAP